MSAMHSFPAWHPLLLRKGAGSIYGSALINDLTVIIKSEFIYTFHCL